MKIAVTGATGQLGRIVVNRLKEKIGAQNIVALVRSTQKAADLGVEARKADYNQPETLDAALQGIETLVFISGSEIGKRIEQHKNVIDAAKKAGTKRIIYTSFLRADTTSLPIAGEHVATEKFLKDSGLVYTILRVGWYTENYETSVASAVASGTFIGSAGSGKISSAPRKDYAEAVVVAAATEGHEGKIYELAGDEAFTMTELATEVSKLTGKDVSYTDLPAEEYTAVLEKAGLPEGLPQVLAGIDVSVSRGDMFENSYQLSKLIGRSTIPLREVVAEMLKVQKT
jgi:NAD(P)H dehydrogenase (quinone)